MKITDMIKREDFYKINDETLSKYFKRQEKNNKKITLYVYPNLNAIIPNRVSCKVKKFLHTEYNVNQNLLKKLAINLYICVSLNTFGLFSSKKLEIDNSGMMSKNFLIYPCNKKYRVFDFEKHIVEVFVKSGFSNQNIEKEIKFRNEYQLPFILPIKKYGENWYEEEIIDGVPLARISSNYEMLCKEALSLWENFNKTTLIEKDTQIYIGELKEKIEHLIVSLKNINRQINYDNLNKVTEKIFDALEQIKGTVDTVLSHGDLQSGNIWVENNTDKIYIIDWESCERRSIWYDRALLFDNIRRKGEIGKYCMKMDDAKYYIVVLEDIIFKLDEIVDLPFDYGDKDFDEYIEQFMKG